MAKEVQEKVEGVDEGLRKRFKEVRATLGLTQRRFASRIAVSTSYVTGMERGNKKISERTIRQLSREFGINEHWLVTGEGEMYSGDDDDSYQAELVSLFRSLHPQCQEVALHQLAALADLEMNRRDYWDYR
ncbi:MAG: helix-turn-helix domain-containing protein [Oscillospiraceae bacterium]|nr:helix-turn-helix domain-containing protein [Oscillospiraceae bacterium]